MARKSSADVQLEEGPRKVPRTQSDLGRVVAALEATAGGPAGVSAEALGMLVDAAPFALSPTAGVAPHQYVDTIASFIRSALESPKAQAVEQATVARTRTAEARAELEVVEQKQGEAIDAANAAKGAVQAALKAIRRAELAVKRGEADLKAAEASHAERRSARELHEADRQRALEMLECHFSALTSGTADSDMQVHLNVVTRFLQEIGAEESLVVSVPAICEKPVAVRTQWDLLAMEECKRALVKHQEAMLTKVQAALKAEREAEAEALGEAAIQWVNTRKLAESRSLHNDAEVTEAAADEEVNEAFEIVGTHQEIVNYLQEQSNHLDVKVRDIEESLEALECLRHPATPFADESEEGGAIQAQPSTEQKALVEDTLTTALLSKPTPCR